VHEEQWEKFLISTAPITELTIPWPPATLDTYWILGIYDPRGVGSSLF
jgi:hypothetical protein